MSASAVAMAAVADERKATQDDYRELLAIARRLATRHGNFSAVRALMHVCASVLDDMDIPADYVASLLAQLHSELDTDDRGVRH